MQIRHASSRAANHRLQQGFSYFIRLSRPSRPVIAARHTTTHASLSECRKAASEGSGGYGIRFPLGRRPRQAASRQRRYWQKRIYTRKIGNPLTLPARKKPSGKFPASKFENFGRNRASRCNEVANMKLRCIVNERVSINVDSLNPPFH